MKSRITSNIFLTIILIVFLTAGLNVKSSDIEVTVVFGETHQGEEAQLFYSVNNEQLSEENSIREKIVNNQVSICLPEVDLENTKFRFDPFMNEESFTIDRVEIRLRNQNILEFSKKDILNNIQQYLANCKYDEIREKFYSLTDDPNIWVKEEYNASIIKACRQQNMASYFAAAILIYFLYGFLLLKLKTKEYTEALTKGHFAGVFLSAIVVSVGISLNYGVFYLKKNFGSTPLGQLLYHLHTPLDGTNTSAFYEAFWCIAGIVAGTFFILFTIDFFLRKKRKHTGYPLWAALLGVLIGALALIDAYDHFEYGDYYKYTHENTTLYEEYYVDGRDIALTFPEKKRNLIFIFLESMETTYADKNSGGAMNENYISELTELALKNTNFAENELLNGAYTVPGATFTMGALVAQTAGVPINETLVSNSTLNGVWESENNYLPGVWSIGDILAEEGYQQEFMIGSDAAFAGRGSYFHGHGNYKIFDYYKAVAEKKIPDDYWQWWGYEDEKLIEFAKQEISLLAKEEKPFNFTMLTADTHFTDGYFCELCEDDYEEQYSNVIACSSRQIADFVEWIEKQDFYENTTIVISGDHLTMDSAYIQRENADAIDRKTYFTIINPAENCTSSIKQHKYTTLDIMPTTIAALGIQIEGERLGLGVNLFSDVPTLYEEYGENYLEEELLKNSKYYTKKLLYGNKK